MPTADARACAGVRAREARRAAARARRPGSAAAARAPRTSRGTRSGRSTKPAIERSAESRHRVAERQQAEVAARAPSGPPISPVAFCAATWNTMNDDADQRRADEQRGQPGHDERARTRRARAPHEPTSIGRRTPMRSASRPGGDAQQHRQQRVQRHQHADGRRRRAVRQRVERDRHARCPPAPTWFAMPRPISADERSGDRGRASRASRREPVDRPRAGAVRADSDAIVQPRGAALPELDRVGHDAIAAPVRRPRHRRRRRR